MNIDNEAFHRCPYVTPEIDQFDEVVQEQIHNRTRDHLVARVVMSDHGALFKPLKDARQNTYNVCEFHHILTDTHKLKAYAEGGLVGVFSFLAKYPVPDHEKDLRQLFNKLKAEFSLVKTSLSRVKPVNEEEREEYHETGIVVRDTLECWEDGGIDAFVKSGITYLPSRDGVIIPFRNTSGLPILNREPALRAG